MKLKYKKLIIIISIGALLLSFLILTLIPTGGDFTEQIEDAPLTKCENADIIQLVGDYFQAKRDVDMERMDSLVSDCNQIDQEKLITQAEYVEDYRNIVCYTLENKDNGALRVYIRYDMKLKNIETLAPCLSGLYITMGSDGKNVIYLSALDENEEDFILAADKNSNVAELQEQVAADLQAAVDADEAFRQLYQQMDQEIQSVDTQPQPDASPTEPQPDIPPTDVPAEPTPDIPPTAAPAQ